MKTKGLHYPAHLQEDMLLASNEMNQKLQEDAIVATLKACIKRKDLRAGSQIHAEILRKGLFVDNVYVGNNLVNMYAKCGALVKAQEVFDGLQFRKIVSWNALIGGYAQHGYGKEALKCYQRMQCAGLSPNAITYVCILKACGSIRAAKKGREIHAEIARAGLLKEDILLGNALIDMYIKCGLLLKAQEVLDELPVRDVISWTGIIAGYAQQGHGKEALNCFERMQREGISANDVTFLCILKACGSIGAAEKGKEIHAAILREGLLEKDTVVGTALVDMYARCGVLVKAQEVFDELPVRDVISWSVLIAGYVQHGRGEEALNCVERMQQEGLSPNSVTFLSILKACGSIGAVDKGKEIHAEMVREGMLKNDVLLGTTLVDMYAKCGVLDKAQEVFNELPVRDLLSWNILITGFAEHGLGQQALNCFEKMQREGISPNVGTYVTILGACSSIGAFKKGEEIHAEIARDGLLEKDILVGSALVDLYAKCGALAKAQKLFDELPVRNVVSWTALIAGYAQHGQGEEALDCFQRMQREGLSPNVITFVCVLKACGSIGAVDKGKEVHAAIIKLGLLDKDIVVGNALVDMYAKCGALSKAQEVLDELAVRNVVTWSALITGYTQHGHGEEALSCFEQMRRERLSPDVITFACILKACGSIGAVVKGKEVHAEIVKAGLLEKEVLLGNALVDMYAKCGVLGKAQEVFDKLTVRNVISWSTLITGYAQHRHNQEALNCFRQMQREGLSPNSVVFLCTLKACASIGAVDMGIELHAEIIREGLLEKDIVVATALVDMYSKCGALPKAQEVFDGLTCRDVILWNALITGYGQCGKDEKVFDLLNKMLLEGIEPNLVTFTVLLNVCSHSGLVAEGQMYFETMTTDYGIIPALEHYSCMVDLFGRAGHFDKAVAMVKKMPCSDHPPVWSALLGACQKWGNVGLGKLAFKQAVQLDEKDDAVYLCMSNIYKAAGMQEDADKIETMRAKR